MGIILSVNIEYKEEETMDIIKNLVNGGQYVPERCKEST